MGLDIALKAVVKLIPVRLAWQHQCCRAEISGKTDSRKSVFRQSSQTQTPCPQQYQHASIWHDRCWENRKSSQ